MATASTSVITATSLGTGTTDASTAQRSLDTMITNLVRKETPVLSEAMKRNKSINNYQHGWTRDTLNKPTNMAKVRGAGVSASDGQARSVGTVYNNTQIFGFEVSVDNTALAMNAAGGNPQTASRTKQLAECMMSIEAQLLDSSQIGTRFEGTSGTAIGSGNFKTSGSRMGSIFSYALTHSFNTTSGSQAGLVVSRNNISTDVATDTTLTAGSALGASIAGDGSTFFKTTNRVNQQFAPVLYKQLLTEAKKRFQPNLSTMLTATHNRTHLSDKLPTSRSINRVDSKAGDSIESYSTDFGVVSVQESHVLSSMTSPNVNSVLFYDPSCIGLRTLRPLQKLDTTASNADGQLEAWVYELTTQVNGEGLAVLWDIAPDGVDSGTTPRASGLVSRQTSFNGFSY